MNTTNLKGIIGVMVEFQVEGPDPEDDDLRTSGNGKFITIDPDIDDAYPSFINYADLSRCSKSLLDPPPHNAEYFKSQLKAVTNYYIHFYIYLLLYLQLVKNHRQFYQFLY